MDVNDISEQIEKAACVLFDSDAHPELSKLYESNGEILTWGNAPRALKEKYRKKATETIKQLGYVI